MTAHRRGRPPHRQLASKSASSRAVSGACAIVAIAAIPALSVSGCGSRDAPPPPPSSGASERAELGGEDVARVAGQAIPASLVARVALARGEAPVVAIAALVDDARLAAAASARRLSERPAVARDLRAVRARLVVDRVRRDAAAGGPLTDAELATLTARHWRDLARPESVHVVHAIVLRPKAPALLDEARAAAKRLHDDLASAPSAAELEARARAFPRGALDVRVEDLPAFAEDGSVVDVEGKMDATFARAAFALPAAGATSDVVETSFGFHVIRLVERIPPKITPIDERRAKLAEEGLTVRSHDRYASLIASLRAASAVEVRPDVEPAMAEAASAVFAAHAGAVASQASPASGAAGSGGAP